MCISYIYVVVVLLLFFYHGILLRHYYYYYYYYNFYNSKIQILLLFNIGSYFNYVNFLFVLLLIYF